MTFKYESGLGICSAQARARMCRALLNAVNFEVMMVEEAAEIQEAHVISALQPTLQRMIMIGDHMQLRPKINSFELSVRSCPLLLSPSRLLWSVAMQTVHSASCVHH